ncbi:MAG: hypothetical protein WC322_03785 [Candidatus Paceibacterota bacterium]|jgi:hypothetical protein
MTPTITLIVNIAGTEQTGEAPLAIDLAGVFRGSSWGPGAFLDTDKLLAAFPDAPPAWLSVLTVDADFIAEAINTAINEADCRYELSRNLGLEDTPIHVAWVSDGIDTALDAIQGAR